MGQARITPTNLWGVSVMVRCRPIVDYPAMTYEPNPQQLHSPGWVAQVWIAFGISTTSAAIGLVYLPVDPWVRAFLAISFLMAISSSISLSKTLRDIHESSRLVKKIDEAKVNKLLSEHPVEF